MTTTATAKLGSWDGIAMLKSTSVPTLPVKMEASAPQFKEDTSVYAEKATTERIANILATLATQTPAKTVDTAEHPK